MNSTSLPLSTANASSSPLLLHEENRLVYKGKEYYFTGVPTNIVNLTPTADGLLVDSLNPEEVRLFRHYIHHHTEVVCILQYTNGYAVDDREFQLRDGYFIVRENNNETFEMSLSFVNTNYTHLYIDPHFDIRDAYERERKLLALLD